MKSFSLIKFVIGIALVGVISMGCGSATQEVDQNYVQKSTDNAKLARSLFDAKGGTWEALDADSKKKMTDAYGTEQAAKTVWDSMANPPIGGGAPSPGTPQ
jgi:hypothetical protein